jgi:hypothetical protein
MTLITVSGNSHLFRDEMKANLHLFIPLCIIKIWYSLKRTL